MIATDSRRLPDFVVIGAAKCGTTSLYHYLKQHPGVYMAPRREPSFFAHEGEKCDFRGPGDNDWTFITDVNSYMALFEKAPKDKVLGEVSPRYLFFPQACERMQKYVPSVRIVAILRHPVDRAYSHFLMNRRRGCEPEARFERAIEEEARRRALGWGWDWSYISAGKYFAQLKRYFDRFSADQIKILIYDDLEQDKERLFGALFRFIGVADTFEPDTAVVHRQASVPRSYRLQEFLRNPPMVPGWPVQIMSKGRVLALKRKITAWNAERPSRLSDDARQRIFGEYFEEDCAQLESLIDRSLSTWRM